MFKFNFKIYFLNFNYLNFKDIKNLFLKFFKNITIFKNFNQISKSNFNVCSKILLETLTSYTLLQLE